MNRMDHQEHGQAGVVEMDHLKAAMENMDHRIQEVARAATDWGVQPDKIEGKFITALLSAIRAVGEIVVAASEDTRGIVEESKELAELELEKLRKFNVAAAATIREAEVAKEAVVANVTKGLTERLISESQKWLVLKQTDYNRRSAWRLAVLVSLCALGVFLLGYELREWQDAPATSMLMKCLEKPYYGTYDGKKFTLCRPDELGLRSLSAAPAALRTWAFSLVY